MTVRVVQLTEDEFAAWDAFIETQPAATFFHRAGWKTVIEEGAKQKCPYLIAYQDDSVVGVLPLSMKKHFLFGKALISNMFCVYGGAIATNKEVASSLYEAAWDIAKRNNIAVFENRSQLSSHEGQDEWLCDVKSATFIRSLANDDAQQLLDIPRKQRAVIRKSLTNGLSTDWNGDIETFYHLYAQSVHGLGTPVFPKSLFACLKQVFGNDVEIQITRDSNGAPIASLMSFYHHNTALPYYAGGGGAARALAAHDYMYFQLMLHARARGASVFDFGRSKVDSGPYKFKKNWGFEPIPLYYEWRLAGGKSVPEMSQQSGMYGVLTQWWKKLPLSASKLLGPPIARHLG